MLNCANSMWFFDRLTSKTQKYIKIDICIKLFQSYFFKYVYIKKSDRKAALKIIIHKLKNYINEAIFCLFIKKNIKKCCL